MTRSNFVSIATTAKADVVQTLKTIEVFNEHGEGRQLKLFPAGVEPLSYETFDGNRPDVTTLETVTRTVERKYGKARRVTDYTRLNLTFSHSVTNLG